MLSYCFPKTFMEVNAAFMSKLAFTQVKLQYVIYPYRSQTLYNELIDVNLR